MNPPVDSLSDTSTLSSIVRGAAPKLVSNRRAFWAAGTFSLLIGCMLVNTSSVQAQMINDPTETLILNSGSPFQAVDIREVAEQEKRKQSETQRQATEEKENKAVAKPVARPLPTNMQPALDIEEETAPAPAEPIKARAVMVDINSNNLNYDKDHDVYIATGLVHMVISEQNSELFADKLTYDQNQNLAIAEGNVIIIKDGQKTHGSYAKIDLSRKSALINDYQASVEQVRIKAKQAFVNSKYVQYENGRIILQPGMLQAAMGKGGGKHQPDPKQTVQGRVVQSTALVPEEDISQFGAVQREMERTELDNEGGNSAQSNDPTLDADGVKKSRFSLKMKEMDIHRDANGFNRVIARKPGLYMGNRKILGLTSTEFSFDQPSGDMQYLGPDIGYDPDYGGMYFGPGWDFRAGEHGSIRISPLLSFGGGGRRSRGGARFEDRGVGPGVGGIVHYRDPKTFLDFGYNSRVGQPVLLGERKLFDGKTRLRVSANEDYVNGFLGYERPGYGVMISDTRQLAEFGKFRVDGQASAGWFKDEFFPTFEKDFFVDAKDEKPGMAGRAQIQTSFRNTQPLLRVGEFLDFGVRADMTLAGYTTGDFAGLLRGGPTMNLRIGDRLRTSLQYYYAASAGDTPFVFDSYYRGRQNVVLSNAFKVSNFLTLGMRSNMSLMRDNAKDSLFTGNALYMLVGPKEVKVNLAYDVIRKRSYFGLNFFPGTNGSQAVDFEKMRIFQPENYNGPVSP